MSAVEAALFVGFALAFLEYHDTCQLESTPGALGDLSLGLRVRRRGYPDAVCKPGQGGLSLGTWNLSFPNPVPTTPQQLLLCGHSGYSTVPGGPTAAHWGALVCRRQGGAGAGLGLNIGLSFDLFQSNCPTFSPVHCLTSVLSPWPEALVPLTLRHGRNISCL